MSHHAQLALDALRGLYGEPFLRSAGDPAGVVHVTALWRASASELRNMRINDDTPRSASDLVALNGARARADAIISTGKILRDEPGLGFDLSNFGDTGRSLAAWRAQILGKPEPPYLLVLTSGRDLPRESPLETWHPALRGWARPIVYTSNAAADSIDRSAGTSVRVVGAEQPDIRTAIAYLRAQLDCRTILIEAGPSTANALYDDPVAVDELLLSVYRGGDLPATVRGGPSVAPARLAELFGVEAAQRVMRDRPSDGRAGQPSPDDSWSFWRLLRR